MNEKQKDRPIPDRYAVRVLTGGKVLGYPEGTDRETLLKIGKIFKRMYDRGVFADFGYMPKVGVVDSLGRVVITGKEIEEEMP